MAPSPPADWEAILASEKVSAAPGNSFYSSEPAEIHFRLSVSSLDEEKIEEGIRRLGRAFGKVYERKG